jgi:hypothetical protein
MILRHDSIVMMLFKHINLRLIIVHVQHGIQLLQLKLLCVEAGHRRHQIIAVAFIPMREFDLIKFILDHDLVSEHVVEGADIGVIGSELCRLLYQAVLLVVVLLCHCSISKAAGGWGGIG